MVFERVVSTPNPRFSHEVLYIGSAVPLETSEGLEAVQQPLRARYPVDNDETIQGVLSTLAVVPEGIQLRFQGENAPPILFLYSSLSMCAAVRCVKMANPTTGALTPRFVSLSSPEAGGVNSSRPAIFTAITRRTKGRQVLECHGFVTNTPQEAIDLVQWTAAMDKRSKSAGQAGGSNYSTIGGPGGVSSAGQRFDGDVSFRASETSSLPDFPIQIKPAESLAGNSVAPGSFAEPSKDGYFYSTKNTQVKRYSLQRFQGSSGVDDTPSVIGVGADQFVRRAASAYAPSQISTPASYHHHQHRSQQSHLHEHQGAGPVLYPPPPPGLYPVGVRPHPMMIPVRAVRPPPPSALVRPVYVGGPPPPHPLYMYPRSPRFFSPPPPPLRARPLPMYVVPPGEVATLPRPARGRRGSRGSSHSSSDHSSSPSPARVNGKPSSGKKHEAEESDGSSSRPQTPPTDYEGASRGPRISRREDYLMRERNGFATGPGVYMMAPYSFYPPPPGTFERARSQPPVDRKSKKSDKKAKKNSKKSAKNGGSRHHHRIGDPYESTDSVGGYQSELLTGSKSNAENRFPRDFRRMENQFQHERAFSKSLAEEQRKSTRSEPELTNAYSLNNMAVAEAMEGAPVRDGHVARDADGFPMY
ncbi:serine/arginine repetitive matrix protein 1-like [Plakobranchus ocellatus]|uniref:Serine/arginine repetitive matrix protein 1-like n=1 Tax=Plakobranchus ocellatus TaxID=259542 RepID=A0AAV4A0J1_9GAST|nr:serine/arginine repetitive matrix protein 1-like [Plakobranchus ocellatus]